MERQKLTRHEKWPRMLSDFLEDHAQIPFEYGVHDCMLFAADCIWYLTGFDPAWNCRGTYATESEATAILTERGGMVAAWEDTTGLIGHTDGSSASRGDIVMIEHNGSPIFGVVDDTGARLAFLTTDHGIARVPLENILKVWSY